MHAHDLTDRDFWRRYWSRQKPGPVSDQPFFAEWLPFFPKAPARFIEIGGFPGTHSAFFRKYRGYDVSLLDFVVDAEVIRDVERVNGLEPGSIRVIQADFLERAPTETFDAVFSAGFIEHFGDVAPVFRRHCDYLAPGGTLFVSLPNFRGPSGWVQRWIDPENYRAHNRDAMDPRVFARLVRENGLTPIHVAYAGVPHLWIDHPETVPAWKRFVVRGLSWAMQKLGQTVQGRWISPYIVVVARKT